MKPESQDDGGENNLQPPWSSVVRDKHYCPFQRQKKPKSRRDGVMAGGVPASGLLHPGP